jgi:hypothetical protein
MYYQYHRQGVVRHAWTTTKVYYCIISRSRKRIGTHKSKLYTSFLGSATLKNTTLSFIDNLIGTTTGLPKKQVLHALLSGNGD